tara:strand:+ start:256 stop:546 length:291 start_codon:yes stop_codon:yes gene_type:complete
MPEISTTIDTAGGKEALLIATQNTVFANKKAVIVDGDSVTAHGTCFSVPSVVPHCAATMIAKTNKVFVGDVAVVNKGDLATCGDAATGEGDVIVGG